MEQIKMVGLDFAKSVLRLVERLKKIDNSPQGLVPTTGSQRLFVAKKRSSTHYERCPFWPASKRRHCLCRGLSRVNILRQPDYRPRLLVGAKRKIVPQRMGERVAGSCLTRANIGS